MDIIVNIL